MAKDSKNQEQSQRRIIQEEVGKGVKKVADQITNPLTSFLPGLVASMPGGEMMKKMVMHLARPVPPPVVNVESKDDKKKGGLSAAQVEKANADARADKRQTTLLEKIAGGIGDMAKGFLNATKKAGGLGLGVVVGLLAAPIITLVNFFKSLGAQLKFLNTLSGGRLAKLFGPFVRFFDAIGDIVKKGGTGKMLKGSTFRMFGRFTRSITNIVGMIKKVVKPIMAAAKASRSFMSGFGRIARFFAGFGRILGRLFLPITIVMTLWDGITGFLDGFKESDGDSMLTKIIDGIGEGLGKIVGNLIGFPLNLLRDGVAWIGTKLGFDMSGFKDLDFKQIIKDLIAAPFNMISKGIDWIVLKFSDPVKSLTDLWNGLMGDGGLIDIIFKPIDKAIAWVKGLFGWSSEGQEEFSITTFIKGIFTSVKDWFVGLFSWGKDAGTNAQGDFSFLTLITGVFTSVKEWFMGLFSWGKETGTNAKGEFSFLTLISGVFDSVKKWFTSIFSWSSEGQNEEGFSILGAVTAAFGSAVKWVKDLFSWPEDGNVGTVVSKFIDIVLAPYNLAINWLLGLFGWSSPDGESFSIGKLVTDTITKIFDWFKGLLDFDFMGLIAKIPGAKTVMKFFNKDEELKAAEESGLYDKDLIGASEIDRDKATTAPIEQLQAILDDDDLRKTDKAYIEQIIADRATALEQANAALQAAQDEAARANGGVLMVDNSTTTTNQTGGGTRTQIIPLSNHQAWESGGHPSM